MGGGDGRGRGAAKRLAGRGGGGVRLRFSRGNGREVRGAGGKVKVLTMIECKHTALNNWVAEIAALCQPDAIHWCDGSQAEYDALAAQLVAKGTFIRLDEAKRPGSYLARSNPADVARVEDRTFVCPADPREAGPNNHWRDPAEMKAEMTALYRGSMRGRTMYVIPFSMGPVGSPISRIGVELTDSAYVACNMRIMTRVGGAVLDELGTDGEFLRCLHSVGYPLADGRPDVPWPCDPDRRYITHFPDDPAIWSYGSGYGGNALLGKKCFALRIATTLARKQGWLAEHMLILGLTNPEGKKIYVAAAFPSACGKTNLAMLTPTLPGWKAECVGDDICWMKFGDDGRLHAINPEAGFFGVAPGTSFKSNPNAMRTIAKNTIFTNCALTPDGDIWWEDMTDDLPPALTDWKGNPWTPASGTKAAHPNARYTTPASQCPVIDPAWEDPAGVPISAILFGGRRPTTVPLCMEARNWTHGTFLGSVQASETTAAAAGNVGVLRIDPMAMLPFCGYNMGDYFQHWLDMEKHPGAKLPRIFYVNWFRKSDDGRFLWPGFGDNSRVLKWVFQRCEGTVGAKETPIGLLPDPADLDLDGLDLDPDDLDDLLTPDIAGALADIPAYRAHYAKFGDAIPAALTAELDALEARLRAAAP